MIGLFIFPLFQFTFHHSSRCSSQAWWLSWHCISPRSTSVQSFSWISTNLTSDEAYPFPLNRKINIYKCVTIQNKIDANQNAPQRRIYVIIFQIAYNLTYINAAFNSFSHDMKLHKYNLFYIYANGWFGKITLNIWFC